MNHIHYEFGCFVASFPVPHVIILLYLEKLGAITPYINVIAANLNDLSSRSLLLHTKLFELRDFISFFFA